MFSFFRREGNRLTKHRRIVSDYLVDYPIYQPPHRQGPNYIRQADSTEYRQSLSEFAARGRENFAYFIDQRLARIAALQTLLAKFSVHAGIDDFGLAAVSAWCPGNCGRSSPSFVL